MSPWIWGGFGLVLGGLEIALPGLFLIFPAIGAIVVALAGFLVPLDVEGQLALFALLSLGLWILTLRAYRRMTRRQPAPLVNSPKRLVGQVGVVAEPITPSGGRIRLGDTLWLARGPALEPGRTVTVEAVEGTVLVVRATD